MECVWYKLYDLYGISYLGVLVETVFDYCNCKQQQLSQDQVLTSLYIQHVYVV